ncbi:pyrroline-5-carboxylate reductase [Calditrichota bacterium GD2]
MSRNKTIAIIGVGNLGGAIARGLKDSGEYRPQNIILTRRHIDRIAEFGEAGFKIEKDNLKAAAWADLLIITVEPQQMNRLLDELAPVVDVDRHVIISCVTGVSIRQIKSRLQKEATVVRAMPNTGVAVRESMTCLATEGMNGPALRMAEEIFSTVGKTLIIDEEQMAAATALGACGVAFFLRAIRAASQGGIEIGFPADKAMLIAAQTSLGAARLLLENQTHPEAEIDRVTTPRGVTISGLNTMEHQGFSSAMIKGIVTSWEKAFRLYREDKD